EIAPQAPGEAREGLEDEGPRPDGGRVAVGRPLDEAVPRHRLRAHADHRMPAGRATDSRRGIARLRGQAGAVERRPEAQSHARADMGVDIAELEPALGDHVAVLAEPESARRLDAQRHAGTRPELVSPGRHAIDAEAIVHRALGALSLGAGAGEADLHG